MEILEIRTLRGPNYWSGYWKKLIIMRLDIGDYEGRPTDKIEGFYDRMKEVMPSLAFPWMQLSGRGRISRRVEEGTWAGHVIEHFALELQTLAGMDTGYGRTRETSEKGIYNVVFSYHGRGGRTLCRPCRGRLLLDLAENRSIEEIKADDRQRHPGDARDPRGCALWPIHRIAGGGSG